MIWSTADRCRCVPCAWCDRWATTPICVLGNHDLHLLAVALTGAKLRKSDTLGEILERPTATRCSSGCCIGLWRITTRIAAI